MGNRGIFLKIFQNENAEADVEAEAGVSLHFSINLPHTSGQGLIWMLRDVVMP